MEHILNPGSETEENYLDLNLKVLYMSGLWPKKGFIGRLTLLAVSILVMFMVFFVGAMREVYNGLGSFLVLTESLGVSFLVAVTFHKYLMLIRYEQEFKRLVLTVNRYFFMPEQRHRPEQHQVVQTQDKYARHLTVVFLILCIFTVSGFTFLPIVEGMLYVEESNSTTPYVWKLPYKISYPIDTSGSLVYTILYFYHVYVGLAHIFLIPACDNFIVSLMCHVIGQFSILKDSLENLRFYAVKKVESKNHVNGLDTSTVNVDIRKESGPFLKEDQDDDLQWYGNPSREHARALSDWLEEVDTSEFHTSEEVHREMDRGLRDCVKHHQTILEFVDLLENIVNRMMLSQFFASSMMFCTAAFQLTSPGTNKMMQIMSMGGLITGALLQLGMYCYFADRVQEESGAVGTAAYSAQWYHATPRLKRSIAIIISRSQKPAMLTMGKFADLSLDTYATILKGSYTYFAMLSELNG